MTDSRHPIIGQEYEVNYDAVEENLALGGYPDSVIPVEQSDTGNLVVHNCGENIEDEPHAVEWQPGAFAEYVRMGVLEENQNN